MTGASGYIGLHILRELLAAGQEVTALVRSRAKLGPFADEPRVHVVESDLEQNGWIVDALLHHDACVHAALIWGEPETEPEARDGAVVAQVFHAAATAGVARSVYLSSAAVHRPFAAVMGEDDPLRPTDAYGATKACGERWLGRACEDSSMTGIVLRPGPVVGPPAFEGGALRIDRRIAEMVDLAAAGRPIEVVDGEGRQLSDVTEVARAVRLLTEADQPEPTYLCVDCEILPWERIARMVVEVLDSPSEVRVRPRDEAAPVPRFRTDRIEALLGGPTNAEAALRAHLRLLAEGHR
ncbi:MAG: NAD(P)-dependent oxidoreductase [Planctomycetota bacterium]|nr:NAD(P)-dependent oxidoreductase [Planctomycetota bacterium]